MKSALWLLIFLAAANLSFCQANRISEKNSIGWITTTISPSISKKISWHVEYQWRRADFLKSWQQSLFRTGITYKVHPQVSLQLGYAWAQTFAYGTYSLSAIPKDFPEHRIYEQVVVNSTIGKAAIINRFRLEQRWVGRFGSNESEEPEFVFLNRLRYMPRIDLPINEKWYASVYDEILIGFGKNVGENVFDQNRISGLIGYKVCKALKIEGGFLNQTVQLGREISNKNVFQYNSGLILNTYLNF